MSQVHIQAEMKSMNLDCLNGLSFKTYDKWAIFVEQLRQRAIATKAIAEAEEFAYERAAKNFAYALLQSEGIKRGDVFSVNGKWSSKYPFGAEYFSCEFFRYEGGVCITGYKLNKNGTRYKNREPDVLCLFVDRNKDLILRKSSDVG